MLNGVEISRRGIVDLARPDGAATHVQPNGVDLSVDMVWRFVEAGVLAISNDGRHLPDRTEIACDANGWLNLGPGMYGLRYAERVTLPVDCGALCFPRSSLLRMGVHVPTAVWDAGYVGRGEGLLVVGNPLGVRLQRGSRIAQLVVFQLAEAASSTYAGRYQNENA